jgi:serine protease Do
MKNFLVGLTVSLLILFSAFGGALADRLFVIKPLDRLVKRDSELSSGLTKDQVRIVEDEGAVVGVVDEVGPAVVTVAVVGQTQGKIVFDSFDFFKFRQEEPEVVQRDIGSGFVVDGDKRMVVTNRHVVNRDGVKYVVIDQDGEEFEVKEMYKDPVNDLAILQLGGETKLTGVGLGDSDKLKVGQRVVAIGTALGEFRQTVTTGVVSGLGRGISAGSGFSGVERLDNVIQTDAAINPGNSGGPLLSILGKVVGVNVAVAGGAENIGFAIPINVVRESLKNFEETGSFERVQLGVKYRMIDKDVALLNDVPAGAYIVEVVKDSVAYKNEILVGDILVSLDGEKVSEVEGGLASMVGKLKTGKRIEIEIFRDGKILEKSIRL